MRLSFVLGMWIPCIAGLAGGAVSQAPADWLINPEPFKAKVTSDATNHRLILENGLARRVILLAPNAATIDLQNLSSGEHLLRAIAPEAKVTLNGRDYVIGGLGGQKINNYLKEDWLKELRSIPGSYQFAGWKEGPIEPRLKWKKHPEWMSRDLPWPPPGRHVTLRFAPPQKNLPEVEVHYEMYDGIPLLGKWLVVRNTAEKSVRVNHFVSEELRLVEAESGVDTVPFREKPNLWVETDYSFHAMEMPGANKAVTLEIDPDYPTQVNYARHTLCLLKCQPPLMGPDVDVAANGTMESFRTFELLLDSTERERRTLAQRRMYRVIAPWTAENPLMFHKVQSDPKTIRQAIQQAHDVGFEMIIMSFGSGFNFESRDAKYIARYKELSKEANAKGIALGGYSLLASRGAGNPKDNTQGQPTAFGVMPCLGATWGHEYLAQIRRFCQEAGLQSFENDGSYPGDRCAAKNHPYHHGLEDSQWVQWRAITDLYKWCRSEGIFLNVPDWYMLTGSSKTGMGYRETNWSLPRAEQEIIERQNIFDGTWTKTASMGWMFVPLSQYHGGGAAATIEPLDQHREHYEARLANLLGAGVQACWRGPRLYDTEATKALVKKWVQFYKDHRQVLDGDIIHLRRANGLDWDGILHVNPQGTEKGMAFFYNPLTRAIEREIRVSLYYTGLSGSAMLNVNGKPAGRIELDHDGTATLKLTIPAGGHTWVLFTK